MALRFDPRDDSSLGVECRCLFVVRSADRAGDGMFSFTDLAFVLFRVWHVAKKGGPLLYDAMRRLDCWNCTHNRISC